MLCLRVALPQGSPPPAGVGRGGIAPRLAFDCALAVWLSAACFPGVAPSQRWSHCSSLVLCPARFASRVLLPCLGVCSRAVSPRRLFPLRGCAGCWACDAEGAPWQGPCFRPNRPRVPDRCLDRQATGAAAGLSGIGVLYNRSKTRLNRKGSIPRRCRDHSSPASPGVGHRLDAPSEG